MTIQVSLRDDLAERLVEEARRLNITAEQLAAIGIADLLRRPGDEFDRIARRVIAENQELLKRLA